MNVEFLPKPFLHLSEKSCNFSFLFLGGGLHLWHMEVTRLGVESELQLLAYTTATAMSDRASSVTYTTAHSNAGSLTHWARPGIEPTSSWILVRFVSVEPQQELLLMLRIIFECWTKKWDRILRRCWIWFVNILLRIFFWHTHSWKITGLLFFVMSVSGVMFREGVMLNERGSCPSASIHWKSL